MPRSEWGPSRWRNILSRYKVNVYGDNFCVFPVIIRRFKLYYSITMFALLTVTLAVLVLSPASASITCLKVGATATARWTNAADENCTWTGIVGSNFGIDPVNGGK